MGIFRQNLCKLEGNSGDNGNSQSSEVQIDVLQGNFEVKTQGQLYTTNGGRTNLTTHEVS